METKTIEVKWYKEFGIDKYGNIDGGLWGDDREGTVALAVAMSRVYSAKGLTYEAAAIYGRDGSLRYNTVGIGRDGEPVIDQWSTDLDAVQALADAKTRLSKTGEVYNVATVIVTSEVPA